MTVPFISAAVPVYNEERYLDGRVRSMLDQDYPKESREWFFVDGSSTDRTPELLESYQARYPGLIRVLQNPGRTAPRAMNTGIRQAKGVYLIRLDAHAEYAPDYFSQCVKVPEETGGGIMRMGCLNGRRNVVTSGGTGVSGS